MVKVTIENDGKVVRQFEGELYVGAVASLGKEETDISCSIIGKGNIDNVECLLAHIIPDAICSVSDDPIMVAGSLIGIHDSINGYIKKYLKEHAAGIAESIVKSL